MDVQTSNKLAILMADETFINATRINISKAAVNISGESQGELSDEVFAARQALCDDVIRGSYSIQQFLPMILSDSTITSAVGNAAETLVAWRDAVTDADVTNRLGGIWTTLASV